MTDRKNLPLPPQSVKGPQKPFLTAPPLPNTNKPNTNNVKSLQNPSLSAPPLPQVTAPVQLKPLVIPLKKN